MSFLFGKKKKQIQQNIAKKVAASSGSASSGQPNPPDVQEKISCVNWEEKVKDLKPDGWQIWTAVIAAEKAALVIGSRDENHPEVVLADLNSGVATPVPINSLSPAIQRGLQSCAVVISIGVLVFSCPKPAPSGASPSDILVVREYSSQEAQHLNVKPGDILELQDIDTGSADWLVAIVKGSPNPSPGFVPRMFTQPLYPTTVTVSFLNLNASDWQSVACTGSVPTSRIDFSVVSLDSAVLLFGGTTSSSDNGGGQASNDVFVFSSDTLEWNKPSCIGDIPSPRSGASMARLGPSAVIVFGGRLTDGTFANDLHILTIGDQMKWQKVEVTTPTLFLPAPRMNASLAITGRSMVIYGGRTDSCVFCDSAVFDLADMQFTDPVIFGVQPPPCYGALLAPSGVSPDSPIVLIGGQTALDVAVSNSVFLGTLASDPRVFGVGSPLPHSTPIPFPTAAAASTSNRQPPPTTTTSTAQQQPNIVPNPSSEQPPPLADAPSNSPTSTLPPQVPTEIQPPAAEAVPIVNDPHSHSSVVVHPIQDQVVATAASPVVPHPQLQPTATMAPSQSQTPVPIVQTPPSQPQQQQVVQSTEPIPQQIQTTQIVSPQTLIIQTPQQPMSPVPTVSNQQQPEPEASPSPIFMQHAPKPQSSHPSSSSLSSNQKSPASVPSEQINIVHQPTQEGSVQIAPSPHQSPAISMGSTSGSAFVQTKTSPVSASIEPATITIPAQDSQTTTLDVAMENLAIVEPPQQPTTPSKPPMSLSVNLRSYVFSPAAAPTSAPTSAPNSAPIADSAPAPPPPPPLIESFDLGVVLGASFLKGRIVRPANASEGVSQQVMDELRRIFLRFSDGTHMPSPILYRVLRHSSLLSNPIAFHSLPVLAKAVKAAFPQGSPELFTYREFIAFLCAVSLAKFPDLVLPTSLETSHKDHLAYLSPALPRDPVLDAMLQPKVISLFVNSAQQLKEVYLCFATKDFPPSISPSWDELARCGGEMSLIEFNMFAESFEISPTLLPKHILTSKILPLCFESPADGTSPDMNLNFAIFLEAIGRIALLVFSRPPYSDTLRTSAERLSSLLDRTGLSDPPKSKKVLGYLKKAGLAVANKMGRSGSGGEKALIGGQNGVQPSEVWAILRDQVLLADELERIFLHYSGDSSGTCVTFTAAKFSRFCKDTRILEKVAQKDVDTIFLSHSSKRDGQMRFAQFMDSLTTLGSLPSLQLQSKSSLGGTSRGAPPTMAPEEQVVSLLADWVLPTAHRLPSRPYSPSFVRRDSKEWIDAANLVSSHSGALMILFSAYIPATCNPSDVSAPLLPASNLAQICADFAISPSLAARQEVTRIARSALLPTSTSTTTGNPSLSFRDFCDSILKISALAFGKHPWTSRFPTLSEKIQAILEKLFVVAEPSVLRKRLEQLGRKPLKNLAKSGRGGEVDMETGEQGWMRGGGGGAYSSPIRRGQAKATLLRPQQPQQEALYLPPEDQLHDQLQWLYGQYAQHPSGTMKFNHFRSFVRDLGITSTSEAEHTWLQSVHAPNSSMTYDLFCDSLTILSQRSFPSLPPTESLKTFLLQFVLPLATVGSGGGGGGSVEFKSIEREDVEWQEREMVEEGVEAASEFSQSLFVIYEKYRMTTRSRANFNNPLDGVPVHLFHKFAREFNITPDLLSASELANVTRIVAGSSNPETLLSFDLFIEAISRCALLALSTPQFDSAYPTAHSKVTTFLRRMDIEDTLKLQTRLRGMSSLSPRKVF